MLAVILLQPSPTAPPTEVLLTVMLPPLPEPTDLSPGQERHRGSPQWPLSTDLTELGGFSDVFLAIITFEYVYNERV